MSDQCLRRSVRLAVQRLEHPVGAEELVIGICRLRRAVRVQEECAADIQVEGIVRVLHAFHAAGDKAVFVFEERKCLPPRPDERILMAGARSRDAAGGDFIDAEPHRHEHRRRVALQNGAVGECEHFRRRVLFLGKVLDHVLAHHHEQGCWNTLAGNIGNREAEVIVVEIEEIVEVAPDLPGRLHGCIQREITVRGKVHGQDS